MKHNPMRHAPMQHLTLQGLNDPFTLLKIMQLFREIQVGEELVIHYEDASLLDELCKVLPDKCYEVIEQEKVDQPGRRGVVLRKTASICDRPPTGGCRCP
jgi:hypothetical protein